MKFKFLLILIYLVNAKDLYSYNDIVKMLGLTYKQVEDIINRMIDNDYLLYNHKRILTLTEHSINLLKDNNLLDINLTDLLTINNNIKFSKEKLDINDLYIPKGFDKKFKGY